MPLQASEARLAATPGNDFKRIAARRALATEFFEKHVFEPGGDWDEVRRVMQGIDFQQPVLVGPHPPAPERLVMLGGTDLVGGGFFAEKPPAGAAKPRWWRISPDAPYLKWFAVFVPDVTDGVMGEPGDARYFVPAARNGPGILARPI